MYGKRKVAPYMTFVEHIYVLAVRQRVQNVRGEVTQKWHQDTIRWLNEKCTPEERALIVDFYTYSQSVRDCRNYKVTEPIYDIAERYACDMGLWAKDESEREVYSYE